jgi:hypothetical protein
MSNSAVFDVQISQLLENVYFSEDECSSSTVPSTFAIESGSRVLFDLMQARYTGLMSSTSRANARSRHQAKPDRRRALELLASSPHEGCTEAIMLANGISIEQMVELVRAGLATVTPQRVKAGHERMEVATLRITDSGRQALSAQAARR